jgi:hypothetical protein
MLAPDLLIFAHEVQVLNNAAQGTLEGCETRVPFFELLIENCDFFCDPMEKVRWKFL